MPASPFAFTLAERVAFDAIRDERPKTVAALRERLVPVIKDLSQSCQGWVVTELEAEDLLGQLRDEFVGRMIAEMEPWGEDEDLRAPAVDLPSRYLLAEARSEFVRRVIAGKRN